MEFNPDDSLTGESSQYKKMTGALRAPVTWMRTIRA